MKEDKLYYYIMGRMVEITKIFSLSEKENANQFMLENPTQGVLAVLNDMVLIANCHDKGLKINILN